MVNWDSFWGTATEREDSAVFDEGAFCGLSRTHRLYGFGICLVLGLVVSLLSTVTLAFLNLGGFAILYTFGTVLSLAATGFLVGPWKQLKMMFDSTRWLTSLIFITSIIATLVVAFTLNSVILSVIFMIIEFLAFTWYCLSYIPFGRSAVLNMGKSVFHV
ncbi:SFT2-domain-containing protein [Hyaloraphidium curvatum]|nr:SFT2-domain-containing protein [Hyaloraphidium curvatum]